MQLAINALSIGLFIAGIYGLTRDKIDAPWGRWLAGASFACLMIILISSPDGCGVDWDGVSNPTYCD